MPITVRRGIPGNQFISFALMVFCVMKFRYICYHTAWDYFKFDLLNLNLEIERGWLPMLQLINT